MEDRENAPVADSAANGEPTLPTHSPDGVDLTLVRWMLSLTPAERLEALEDFMNSIAAFHGDDDEI